MDKMNAKLSGLVDLNKVELKCTHGGSGIIYRIGNWIGCKFRDLVYSGEPSGDYDRDSQLEALSNYGATY
jgi:hypothetical protein